ncbi:unnamed protein product [Paramecium sonneborni]|uniref:Transmembrane protein n=1 Tax=Paramecium sonneborni TaxID=65129 RepID=A0A8S1KEE0_9CILI|nr:unnamed protein product [Paramecium sonneborni]
MNSFMIKLEQECHQQQVILLKMSKKIMIYFNHIKIKNQIKLSNNKQFIVKDLKPKRNYSNCINNQKMQCKYKAIQQSPNLDESRISTAENYMQLIKSSNRVYFLRNIIVLGFTQYYWSNCCKMPHFVQWTIKFLGLSFIFSLQKNEGKKQNLKSIHFVQMNGNILYLVLNLKIIVIKLNKIINLFKMIQIYSLLEQKKRLKNKIKIKKIKFYGFQMILLMMTLQIYVRLIFMDKYIRISKKKKECQNQLQNGQDFKYKLKHLSLFLNYLFQCVIKKTLLMKVYLVNVLSFF